MRSKKKKASEKHSVEPFKHSNGQLSVASNSAPQWVYKHAEAGRATGERVVRAGPHIRDPPTKNAVLCAAKGTPRLLPRRQPHVRLPPVFLKLPVAVVERAHLTSFQPPADAVGRAEKESTTQTTSKPRNRRPRATGAAHDCVSETCPNRKTHKRCPPARTQGTGQQRGIEE